MNIRRMLKQTAYSSGFLPTQHWRRGSALLTTVMFHRVLPDGGPEWQDADPEYAVSASFFRDCCLFFRRHYNVVGLDDVAQARAGGRALPPRPLLITFDDGWSDNEAVALPILQGMGLPATVFVVPSAVASDERLWWQETCFLAHRRCRLAAAESVWRAAGLTHGPESAEGVLTLVARLAEMEDGRRRQILAPLGAAAAGEGRQMLTPAQLRRLVAGGLAIGAHGSSHTPLPMLADPAREATAARLQLAELLGRPAASAPNAISFPHGRYDERVVRACRAAGYRLLFTSDQVLTPLDGGRPITDVVGRIYISQPQAVDAAGRLDPALLALWLFRRPASALAG